MPCRIPAPKLLLCVRKRTMPCITPEKPVCRMSLSGTMPSKDFFRVAKLVTSNAAPDKESKWNMHCEAIKNYARLHNGMKTVPSNIRKNYHLVKMPLGKQREKFFFGCKIMALNFRELFQYQKGLDNYTQNPENGLGYFQNSKNAAYYYKI